MHVCQMHTSITLLFDSVKQHILFDEMPIVINVVLYLTKRDSDNLMVRQTYNEPYIRVGYTRSAAVNCKGSQL